VIAENEQLVRLAVAVVGGLAVGIEREWSARRERENTRFGGVRTFLLLGLVGGLATLVGETDPRVGMVLLIGGVLLVAIAYLVTAWQATVDATTEVAGLVVLAAGALAGAGRLEVASAVFAGTALVLVEKSRMHAAVERIQSTELEAAARFAVLALVVLPLVPAEPMALLGGLEPRRLWGLVLIFAGLSFGGYVAMRIAGAERGYGWAGLLGGLVSSTAVTLNFARESRARPKVAPALAWGALAASAVLPLRVLVLSTLLERRVAVALLPVVALPLLVGAASAVRVLAGRRHDETVDESLLPKNPLGLFAAIQMALLFVVVLWALGWVRATWGEGGLLGGSVLLGLTDLDALTYSANRLASTGTPVAAAARALAVGMAANSLFKAAIAGTLGGPRYWRRVGLGMGLYAGLFGLGAWFVG